MAIPSSQIGWSQEAKLINQLIKQTVKLNNQYSTNQPSYRISVSRQIGWSNESNLYYQWLRELTKFTAHVANCCTTTTTTTVICACYNVENPQSGIEETINVNYTTCAGLDVLVVVNPLSNITFCAQLGTVSAGAFGIVTGGTNPCTSDVDCVS